MTINEAKELKQKAIQLLTERVRQLRGMLTEIDPRLLDYYLHLCNHSSAVEDDDNDLHCLFELLCALKVLRLMSTYVIDLPTVQKVIRLYEGDWEFDGKKWVHVRGGLKNPSTGSAPQIYRWQPFQTFIWTAIYGIKAWVDTEIPNGSRELLPTEREGKNGNIEDLRRLCTDFTFYAPRKVSKTGLSAYDNLLHFMDGDGNAEIYCVANSQAQSKLLYDRTQMLIRQLDPQGRRIRFTSTTTNWKPGQFRSAQLWALSAGSVSKEGLFAEKVSIDEFGSSPYINNKSGMGSLVNVVQSSMGPRREPFSLTTTTAGNISSGPFIDKLDGMKRSLAREVQKTIPNNPDHMLLDADDRWTALILELDAWELDEEYIFTCKRLRRKVNPMLGITVQHQFYEDEISKARLDPQKKNEVITKLFNTYRSEQVKAWEVTADKIRELQQPRRVTDCLYQNGWDVMVGIDCGGTGDLFAVSYLCVNKRTASLPMSERFFADTEAWITESAMNKSPNRPLFEKWVAQGWLNVCPGDVFSPDMAINALMQKNEGGVNLVMFGFDPAQAKQPINTLKAWLQSLGISLESIRDMVVPVTQNFLTFNPLIGELEYMILGKDPWLHFSESPLWPWCFGNCQIVESREGLRKLLKVSAEQKIDPIHALADALWCFDAMEGKMQ